MEWYEYSNDDILELKEEWKNNGGTSENWKKFWEENLWWNTEKRDKTKNYKRNGDIIQPTEQASSIYTNTDYISPYALYPYLNLSLSLNSNGCVMLNWEVIKPL